MLTCIDWFAGIGGMRLAFERSGYRCVWACERDPDARAVYAYRFGHAPEARDVAAVEPGAIPAADCWVAGFPCQDLSVAGRRAGFDGAHSAAIFALLDRAAAVCPSWLVLENVPGLLSVRGGADFGALLCALEDAGYVGAWRVLNAQWFGVPQRRRRVFLVARRAGADGIDPAEVLLEPRHVRRDSAALRATREDAAGAPRGDARGHRGPQKPGELLTADPVSAHEGKTYSHEGSKNFRLRNIIAFDWAQATSRENRARFDVGAPSPACAATNTKLCIAGLTEGVRRLTPRECERLQGLPDDWTATNGRRRLSDSARYRLIGNSVAVPCVAWVARRLARWMTSRSAA